VHRGVDPAFIAADDGELIALEVVPVADPGVVQAVFRAIEVIIEGIKEL
jgi:hypothetical protein